jgi:hypothetical protein
MVEYALILAHNTVGLVPGQVMSWLSQVRWDSLGYAVLGLLAVRFAVWAFRPNH